MSLSTAAAKVGVGLVTGLVVGAVAGRLSRSVQRIAPDTPRDGLVMPVTLVTTDAIVRSALPHVQSVRSRGGLRAAVVLIAGCGATAFVLYNVGSIERGARRFVRGAFRVIVNTVNAVYDHLLWLLWDPIVSLCTIRYSENGLRSNIQKSMRVHLARSLENVVPDTHSHPQGASHRSHAKAVMSAVAGELGFQLYEVSPSVHDGHLDANREFYETKDLNQRCRRDAIGKHHMLRFVDVDYHTDMNAWLLAGQPILLYTFLPTTLSGSELNSVWHFEEDNKVRMMVSGGEQFEHEIWNWHHSTVVVDYWLGTWVYDVDSYYLGDVSSRRIVALTPRSWTLAPFGWTLPGHRLDRLRPCQDGKTLRLDTVNRNGAKIASIGLARGGCTVLMADELDILHQAYLLNKMDKATIERFLRHANHDSETVAADSLLLYVWMTQHEYSKPPTVTTFNPGQLAPHYQTLHPYCHEEGSTFARMITPCLSTEDPGVPCDSANNDTATIAGRILKVRNVVDPSPKYYKYAEEFRRFLVPDNLVGRGQPLDPMEVSARQTEPKQRERYTNWRWLGVLERFTVKSFMKHESYQTVNDPRNISTVPIGHTVKLSQYTMAFSDVVLKGKGFHRGTHWYIPGSTPKQIAEKLRSFTIGRDKILVVDYSRLDGTISAFLRRQVEEAAYTRYFGYNQELINLLHAEYDAPARTKHGIPYRPGFSRLSGSPLTTDGNTAICGFVAYAMLRDYGCSPTQAWDLLGLVYGDDGVLHHVPSGVAERTAQNLGLKLKVEVKKVGEPVKFLGRLFPDPWCSSSSCQDPSRCIPRLHLTMTHESNVPLRVAARFRADAFMVTDKFTPIISGWCRYVQRKYPGAMDYTKYVRYLELDRPFHHDENEAWPQEDSMTDFLKEAVAHDLNLSVEEMMAIHDKLCSMDVSDETLGDWPQIFLPTEIKVVAAVDGEVRQPRCTKSSLDSKQTNNPEIPQSRSSQQVTVKLARPLYTNASGEEAGDIGDVGSDSVGSVSRRSDHTIRSHSSAHSQIGRGRAESFNDRDARIVSDVGEQTSAVSRLHTSIRQQDCLESTSSSCSLLSVKPRTIESGHQPRPTTVYFSQSTASKTADGRPASAPSGEPTSKRAARAAAHKNKQQHNRRHSKQ